MEFVIIGSGFPSLAVAFPFELDPDKKPILKHHAKNPVEVIHPDRLPAGKLLQDKFLDVVVDDPGRRPGYVDREDIRALVSAVITQALSKPGAQEWIAAYSDRIPAADRAKFVEVVESEMLNLHEGNIARYRIRPSEFAAWQAVWEKK